MVKNVKQTPFSAFWVSTQLFKVCLGTSIFWIMYAPYYGDPEISIPKQIAYIIFFNTGASLSSLMMSLISIYAISMIAGLEKPALFRLTGKKPLLNILFEMLSITLSGLALLVGLFGFINTAIGNLWYAFLIYYFVIKAFLTAAAFGLANLAIKSSVATLFVFVFFILMLFIAGSSLALNTYFERLQEVM